MKRVKNYYKIHKSRKELLGASGMPCPSSTKIHTNKQTKKDTKPDLVLEVTLPEVGHLNRGTGIKQKPKSKTKQVWTNLN